MGGKFVIPGLAIAGGLYGATITVVPTAISLLFGISGSAVIYGRVMTAWGVAALCGPIIGGLGLRSNGRLYNDPAACGCGCVDCGCGGTADWYLEVPGRIAKKIMSRPNRLVNRLVRGESDIFFGLHLQASCVATCDAHRPYYHEGKTTSAPRSTIYLPVSGWV